MDSSTKRLMFQALFFFVISYRLRALKTLYFCKFIKKYKNKLKRFLQRILLEIMKKKILGTSEAWSVSHSSQRPSEPAYYIEDCRISSRRLLWNSSRRREIFSKKILPLFGKYEVGKLFWVSLLTGNCILRTPSCTHHQVIVVQHLRNW